MCTHRPRGIWARIWGGWLTAFALSFAALETTGLLEEGTPGTCSFFLRRLLGTEPPADGEQPC